MAISIHVHQPPKHLKKWGEGKAAGAARVVILGNIESVVKEKCMINIILKTEMHSFLIII